MQNIEVQWKRDAALAAIVRATFPQYRRMKVYIRAAESVTFQELNWSGGSRSEYRACSIDGCEASRGVDMSAPAPWNNQFEGMKCPVPQGFVIVRGGHFCGKESILAIHVNPADMPRLLAAPVAQGV